MRRTAVVVSSIFTLGLVTSLAACATAADDGPLAQEQEQNAAPNDGTKVPPADTSTPNPSSTSSSGGSTSSSSGGSTSSSGGSTSSSSSGGSTSSSSSSGGSSGTSTSSSGGGGSAVCDVSDPLKLFIWQIELAEQASPVPCPCSTGQCCYLGVTCLTDL